MQAGYSSNTPPAYHQPTPNPPPGSTAQYPTHQAPLPPGHYQSQGPPPGPQLVYHPLPAPSPPWSDPQHAFQRQQLPSQSPSSQQPQRQHQPPPQQLHYQQHQQHQPQPSYNQTPAPALVSPPAQLTPYTPSSYGYMPSSQQQPVSPLLQSSGPVASNSPSLSQPAYWQSPALQSNNARQDGPQPRPNPTYMSTAGPASYLPSQSGPTSASAPSKNPNISRPLSVIFDKVYPSTSKTYAVSHQSTAHLPPNVSMTSQPTNPPPSWSPPNTLPAYSQVSGPQYGHLPQAPTPTAVLPIQSALPPLPPPVPAVHHEDPRQRQWHDPHQPLYSQQPQTHNYDPPTQFAGYPAPQQPPSRDVMPSTTFAATQPSMAQAHGGNVSPVSFAGSSPAHTSLGPSTQPSYSSSIQSSRPTSHSLPMGTADPDQAWSLNGQGTYHPSPTPTDIQSATRSSHSLRRPQQPNLPDANMHGGTTGPGSYSESGISHGSQTLHSAEGWSSPHQSGPLLQKRPGLGSKPLPPPPPRTHRGFAGDDAFANNIQASALGGRGGPSDWEHFGASAEDESVDDTEIPGLKVVPRRTGTIDDAAELPLPTNDTTSGTTESVADRGTIGGGIRMDSNQSGVSDLDLRRQGSTSSSQRKTTASSPTHSRFAPTPPPMSEQSHQSPGRTESIVSFEDPQHRKPRSGADKVGSRPVGEPLQTDTTPLKDEKSCEPLIVCASAVPAAVHQSDSDINLSHSPPIQKPTALTEAKQASHQPMESTAVRVESSPVIVHVEQPAGTKEIVQASGQMAESSSDGPIASPRLQEEKQGISGRSESGAPGTPESSREPSSGAKSILSESADCGPADSSAQGDLQRRRSSLEGVEAASQSKTEQQPESQMSTDPSDPYPQLHPWFKNSLARFAEMLHQESNAASDDGRSAIFIDFMKKEFRVRGLRYGVGSEVVPESHPGLQPEFMKHEASEETAPDTELPNEKEIKEAEKSPATPNISTAQASLAETSDSGSVHDHMPTAIYDQARTMVTEESMIRTPKMDLETSRTEQTRPENPASQTPEPFDHPRVRHTISRDSVASLRKGSDPGPQRPTYLPFRPSSDTVVPSVQSYKPYSAASGAKTPFNYRRQSYTSSQTSTSATRSDYKALIGRPASVYSILSQTSLNPTAHSSSAETPVVQQGRRRAATIKEEHAEIFMDQSQPSSDTSVSTGQQPEVLNGRGRPRSVTVKAEHAETFLDEKLGPSVPTVTVTTANVEILPTSPGTEVAVGSTAASDESKDQLRAQEILYGLRQALPAELKGMSDHNLHLMTIEEVLDSSSSSVAFTTDLLVAWEINMREIRNKHGSDRQQRLQRHDEQPLRKGEPVKDEQDFKDYEEQKRVEEELEEYHGYVRDVFDPTYRRLQEEIQSLMKHSFHCSNLMRSSRAGKDALEAENTQPDLCQVMYLHLGLYRKIEALHARVFEAISERDKRYKKAMLQPLIAANNVAELARLDQHFTESEKRSTVEDAKKREQRARQQMSTIEQNTMRALGEDLDYMESISQAIHQILDLIARSPSAVRATSSAAGPRLEEDLTRAQRVLAALTTNAETLMRSFHTAALTLNATEHDLAMANARLSHADADDVSATLADLRRARDQEEERLAGELDHRLGVVRDDLKKAEGEIEGLLAQVKVMGRGEATSSAEMSTPRSESDEEHRERIKRSLEAAKKRNMGGVQA
ncbi:MAG: hypothetical protein M1817_001857 [Caeruleum heppii]|nr:MAG: hypothetical protein M1817_001857 [Caeruleum heppii]